jgi:hypothetical protein
LLDCSEQQIRRNLMGVAKFSAFAVALAISVGSGAALAQQQQDGNQPKTLMEERTGAIGGGQGAPAPKPAQQDKNLSGSTSDTKSSESGSSGGSLQYGTPDKNPEGGLPAQREGAIGNKDRPPLPTTQGGGQ